MAVVKTPELVSRAGEPDVWRVTNSIFPSNSYVCRTDVDGECLIVDPGTDPELLEGALQQLALRPRHVVLTHGHFDHAGGAAHLQQEHGARVFLHPADTKTIKASNFLLMAFKLPFRMVQPVVEPLGAFPNATGRRALSVIPVPGHTPGSCVLRYGSACFTGDTLYANGIGLSRLPGEDHALLAASLMELRRRLDDTWMIHPGHGPSAPFGVVMTRNVALRCFLGLEETQTVGAQR